MVRCTQKICRLLPTKCLIVFDHFVGLALKGLRIISWEGRGRDYLENIEITLLAD